MVVKIRWGILVLNIFPVIFLLLFEIFCVSLTVHSGMLPTLRLKGEDFSKREVKITIPLKVSCSEGTLALSLIINLFKTRNNYFEIVNQYFCLGY